MTDVTTEPRFFDFYRELLAIEPLTEPERRVLRAVNQRVAALPTLDDVIDMLFERTADIFPFDRIGLSFVEEDGRRVVSRYARASYAHILLGKGYSEDLRGSSLATVLDRGTPRIIDDLEAYLVAHPSSRSTKLIVREGIRSSLTCPLTVEGRIVGFMFRSSRQPHAYTQHHAELQMAISERLSQAVEKAWRIEQLTAANDAYMEMLGFVSHELKNPVASMVTDARLLADGYLGELDQRQKDKLERLITKGQYLLNVVREYLDLAMVEGNELQLHPQTGVAFVDVVVEPALEVVRPQLEARGMELSLEAPEASSLKVECDPDLLRIVLVNLVGNAVRYGNEGGAVRLTVAPEADRLRVSVWNEGRGFKPAQRSRLFRKFSRLPEAKADHRGTGLGLYNSWRIIQLHKGRIRADSKPGEWAEFSFDIPQPLPAQAPAA